MTVEPLHTKCSKTWYRSINNKASGAALLGLALIVLTVAVYARVGSYPFVSLDDYDYVTNNRHVVQGFTAHNVMWAFTSVEASNWHPLTWLSHIADGWLYGLNPAGHHLTSVVIHTFTTVLLFLFLHRSTGALWQSFIAAALFALHPLHVESVAWVAERKDVLSGLFFILTLIVYSRFVAQQTLRLYCLALFCYIAGLMAKPMLVTLPGILLLLDIWPLDRYLCVAGRNYREYVRMAAFFVKEKLPFFIFAFLSSLITLYAQRSGGAVASLGSISLPLRIENALLAYVTYLKKTFWPQDLALLYPFPAVIPLWQVGFSLLFLVVTTVIMCRSVRTRPYLLVGWSWFVITLLPVIGLIQVGSQAMADRYMYLPAIGLFIMVSWGGGELAAQGRFQQRCYAILAGAVIVTSGVLTWQQLGYWRDSITLYRHTLSSTAGSVSIHYNLGHDLVEAGRCDEAIAEFRKTLSIVPAFPDAYSGLGDAYFKKGELAAAIRNYQESVRLGPDNSTTHYNLGIVYKAQGSLTEAAKEYREALRLKPDYGRAHNSLGVVYSSTGRLAEAIQEYRHAIRIDPDNAEAHFNLGLDLAGSGDPDGAINEYRTVLRIDPANARAQQQLQAVLDVKKSSDAKK